MLGTSIKSSCAQNHQISTKHLFARDLSPRLPFYPRMYLINILFLAVLSLAAAFPQHHSTRNPHEPIRKFTPPHLNITTLAGNRRNESVIECWTVATLSVSNTPGIQGALLGQLGNPSAVNYFNIPAQFNGGLHNAPVVQ